MREDELVAEEGRFSILVARRLGETDLDRFNLLLFRALAKAEARPIGEAYQAEKAKQQARHESAASPRTPDGKPRPGARR